jgi:hypothetical protein
MHDMVKYQRKGDKDFGDGAGLCWWTFDGKLDEADILDWFDQQDIPFYGMNGGVGRYFQDVSLYRYGSRWFASIRYGMDI